MKSQTVPGSVSFMFGGPIRVLEIYGGPEDLGRAHGEACAEMIRKYLADRVELGSQERWSGGAVERDFLVDTATETLEFHERYSPSLFGEMAAMAEAAGITPAEAVVVGGFTDLVDVVRGRIGVAPVEDDCTALIDPGSGVLAQTWDMHASAGEFVIMLKLDPLVGPNAVVQTTAGCLGQIGLNEAGIAVGINNLTSVGRPGVTWPFVVRKVLEQTDLDSAIKVVLDAPLAGGHNFLILGADGEGANVEAMPGHQTLTRVNGSHYVHTNHCLDETTALEEGERPETSVVSSDRRLDAGYETAHDLESFLTHPDIARRSDDPHEVATCGAVITEPGARRMRAVWGVPGDHPWETFQL